MNTKKLPGVIAPILLIIIGLIVGISITFAYFKFGPHPFPFDYTNYTSQPSPASQSSTSPLPSPDGTAGWKKYTSNNISFQYPKDWNIKEDGSKVHLEKVQHVKAQGPYPAQDYTNSITISMKELPADTTLDNWLISLYGNDKVILPIIQKSAKNIMIGGVNGLALVIPGAGGYDTEATIVIYKNQGYQISVNGLEVGSGIHEAYNQILSTFKFL